MKNSLKTLFVALTVTTALVNVASASDGLGGYDSRENVTREVESFVERVNGGADVGKAFDALSEAGKYEAASNDVYRTMVKVKQRLPFARIADAYLSEGSRRRTAIDVSGDVGAAKLSLEEARRRDAAFNRTAVDVRGDVSSTIEALDADRRRAGEFDRTVVDAHGDVAEARRRLLEAKAGSVSRAASPLRDRPLASEDAAPASRPASPPRAAESESRGGGGFGGSGVAEVTEAVAPTPDRGDSLELLRQTEEDFLSVAEWEEIGRRTWLSRRPASPPRAAESESREGGGSGGSGVSAADFAEARAASASTSRDRSSSLESPVVQDEAVATLERSLSPRVAEEEARAGGGFGGSGVSEATAGAGDASSASSSRASGRPASLTGFIYDFETEEGEKKLTELMHKLGFVDPAGLNLFYINSGFYAVKTMGYNDGSLKELDMALVDSLARFDSKEKFLREFQRSVKGVARVARELGGGYPARSDSDEDTASAFMAFTLNVMSENLQLVRDGYSRAGMSDAKLSTLSLFIEKLEIAQTWLRS